MEKIELQVLKVISSSVLYHLDRTPLLCLLPAHVKEEVAREFMEQTREALNHDMIEFKRDAFVYGLEQASENMPLFSVFSEKAKTNFCHQIVNVCFDVKLQRQFKINNII